MLSPELQWTLNPFHLSINVLGAIFFGKLVAEVGFDYLLDFFLKTICRFPLLPSRVPTPIMKGLDKLTPMDYAMVFMNQFVELTYMSHFAYYAWHNLSFALEDATVVNTIVAFYAAFFFDDFLYYFAHRAMHIKALYPLVHKWHHRQALPRRGYLDAANEHPIEQAIGLSLVLLTFHVVNDFVGMHGVSAGLFFLNYALNAVMNHTVYDVQGNFVFLNYTVRSHEMHHRFPQTNYAQNTMVWDKLFGSYKEYRGRREEGETTK